MRYTMTSMLFVALVVSALAGPGSAGPTVYPADLTITKTADVTSVAPGGLINFTLFMSNWSPSWAYDFRLEDHLPAGLTLEGWSTVPQTLGLGVYVPYVTEIAPGIWVREVLKDLDYFWLYLEVRVDPSYAGDTIVNTAQVWCTTRELDYANNESTVVIDVVHPTVPAPGALLLAGLGAGAVGWLRRRGTL